MGKGAHVILKEMMGEASLCVSRYKDELNLEFQCNKKWGSVYNIE